MHWSGSIETTAYALLALIKFDDLASSAKVVTWLTSNRRAIGRFSTSKVIQLVNLAKNTYIHTSESEV